MSLSIPLTVANPTTTPRFSWPITSGVPLPPGVLSRGNALCLTDASGARSPLQWEPLALWPDGSVKWALLDFQADVPADSEAKFHLEKASGPAPEPRVKLSRRGDAVRIGTGALRVSLDCAQPGLIDGLWLRRADGAEEQVASRLDKFRDHRCRPLDRQRDRQGKRRPVRPKPGLP